MSRSTSGCVRSSAASSISRAFSRSGNSSAACRPRRTSSSRSLEEISRSAAMRSNSPRSSWRISLSSRRCFSQSANVLIRYVMRGLLCAVIDDSASLEGHLILTSNGGMMNCAGSNRPKLRRYIACPGHFRARQTALPTNAEHVTGSHGISLNLRRGGPPCNQRQKQANYQGGEGNNDDRDARDAVVDERQQEAADEYDQDDVEFYECVHHSDPPDFRRPQHLCRADGEEKTNSPVLAQEDCRTDLPVCRQPPNTTVCMIRPGSKVNKPAITRAPTKRPNMLRRCRTTSCL